MVAVLDNVARVLVRTRDLPRWFARQAAGFHWHAMERRQLPWFSDRMPRDIGLRRSVAARFNWRGKFSISLIASGTALVSVALITAYATLLSRQGVPASVLVLSAILFASTLSSIAGFAFSAICGVMLLHMMSDPLRVVETMMVCSIAIQALSVAALWRDIEWRELLTFLAGGTIGWFASPEKRGIARVGPCRGRGGRGAYRFGHGSGRAEMTITLCNFLAAEAILS